MLLNDLVLNFPEDKNIDNIIVRQYISIADKMEIIGNTINNSIDDNDFYNPVRLEIFYILNMVKAYTNIEYAEEDVLSAYDKLVGSGIWQKVEELIPQTEKIFIKEKIEKVIHNIYEYRNSALGVINNIADNYKESVINGEEMQKAIADPENLTLLKKVIDKM